MMVFKDWFKKKKPERILYLPHFRNPHFTGREEILRELRESLISSDSFSKKQVLSGLGGVGKTQITLEYAYRHAEDTKDYSLVWWLHSEDPTTLASEYV